MEGVVFPPYGAFSTPFEKYFWICSIRNFFLKGVVFARLGPFLPHFKKSQTLLYHIYSYDFRYLYETILP